MAEIKIYRCDICGAHSETKPNGYVSYGQKYIPNVCDDCIAELEIAIRKMEGSKADNIVFIKEGKLNA